MSTTVEGQLQRPVMSSSERLELEQKVAQKIEALLLRLKKGHIFPSFSPTASEPGSGLQASRGRLEPLTQQTTGHPAPKIKHHASGCRLSTSSLYADPTMDSRNNIQTSLSWSGPLPSLKEPFSSKRNSKHPSEQSNSSSLKSQHAGLGEKLTPPHPHKVLLLPSAKLRALSEVVLTPNGRTAAGGPPPAPSSGLAWSAWETTTPLSKLQPHQQTVSHILNVSLPAQVHDNKGVPSPQVSPHPKDSVAASQKHTKQDKDAKLFGTKTSRVKGVVQVLHPTRGMLYSVFQDLDVLDEERITYSTFEDAAMQSGMTQHQARKLFSLVDQQQRGYVTIKEWGHREVWPIMSEFTRVYVQRTRGNSGKYEGSSEINTLYAALQMALMKLKLKNSGRSVSHDRLAQAFSFIDRDCSGSLDPQELQDAFNGLGIYVGEKVIEDAMKAFDKDRSGAVDYHEFISVLFPNLSKGFQS
ncbi:hypothetical protein CEUSTIGMA_g7410.t1 [Chlamydomonas eustigma]|uniref:EF-hand domain-containing protein n=1 Tax=Chlamydomonas eustigma TaxID=1157962 RepID=A0A250XA54_9CHLO|nr:hypothetical protein CEUSTIGMA_g7410.t1 [Chlamydomonas eustigma]|eukprot:GAX79971.1 hypothetical protein CEUSTIGMA_g7410.t1 [Chlamydomonas eustigma]